LLISNPEAKLVVRKLTNPELSNTDNNQPSNEDPFDPNFNDENEQLLDPYDTSAPTDDPPTDPPTDPSTGGRRRRVLEEQATPRLPYLDFDSFNLYFQGSLRYEIIIFKTTKDGATYKSIKSVTRS